MKYATLKPRSRPQQWCTGTDPQRRDNYYAYLKHRAQARYRKEPYGLTFSDWEQLWTPELQAQRGTTSESLCLRMLDPDMGELDETDWPLQELRRPSGSGWLWETQREAKR